MSECCIKMHRLRFPNRYLPKILTRRADLRAAARNFASVPASSSTTWMPFANPTTSAATTISSIPLTKAAVASADILRLEGWIDTLERDLPPLRRFILPGGTAAGPKSNIE